MFQALTIRPTAGVCGEGIMTQGIEADNFELGHIFNYVDIKSEYLVELTKEVLLRIHRSENIYEMGFSAIQEGPTISGTAGEVLENGLIILDPEKLKKFPDDVAITLVAHEFAHYRLDHYLSSPKGFEYEREADELANKWGFDVKKFRQVVGPPSLP